jgi:UDP-N-acetylglucosamine 2-epimerase
MLLISFGTRPEWIKIKPIIDEIDGKIPFKILFTGQHTSLIDKSIEDYEYEKLEISDSLGGCRLDAIVCSILDSMNSLDGIDAVMVQGDTTSAFAVALGAFHRNISIIHLEAGLRTFDKQNPYPEEFNRCAITAMADIHLCPTMSSAHNVMRTLNSKLSVHVVGNTVLDNLVDYKPSSENFVLVTMHRRENHDRITDWFKEINDLAKDSAYEFILPMHPNPNVSRHKDLLTHVTVVDPLPYHECIDLVSRCKFLITDSGGLQEESSFFGKRCIVCRKVSERTEGIGDFAFMCPRPENLKNVYELITALCKLKPTVSSPCPYGDGHASEKVAEILKDTL